MSQLNFEDYQKALEFATKKHAGQFRIGGKEYITHPIEVSKILKKEGFGTEYQITGLFHDLLEDTDATDDEILSLSNADVLEAVKLLTKYKDYDMKDYTDNIKKNKIAFEVKCADRYHNLKCAKVADEDFRRKYILETIDWYWDFSFQIREAAKELANTLTRPMKDYPFLYEAGMSLKIDK